MNRDELRSGAIAGVVAAAATAGTLVAIGRRTATASQPFNIVASHIVGTRAGGALGFVADITIIGLLLHIVVTTVLGVITLALVRRRLAPLWLTCVGLSVFCALISVGVARRGGFSLAAVLSAGDLIIYYIVLAASLFAGIRFALPTSALD